MQPAPAVARALGEHLCMHGARWGSCAQRLKSPDGPCLVQGLDQPQHVWGDSHDTPVGPRPWARELLAIRTPTSAVLGAGPGPAAAHVPGTACSFDLHSPSTAACILVSPKTRLVQGLEQPQHIYQATPEGLAGRHFPMLAAPMHMQPSVKRVRLAGAWCALPLCRFRVLGPALPMRMQPSVRRAKFLGMWCSLPRRRRAGRAGRFERSCMLLP